MSRAPTAIIADDEAHLRQHLRRMLDDLWPEIEICAEAGNGQEALQLVESMQPDLLFLDIRMPEVDGIEVAQALCAQAENTGAMPFIVFTTAYDEYAIEAFNNAAADYLLKPIDRERLAKTRERLQPRFARRLATTTDPKPGQTFDPAQLEALVNHLKAPKSPVLQWLRVGDGDTTELLQVSEVVYFRADQKYTSAFTADREHLLRLSLKELLAQLDPEAFWQIHRSLIVNVSDIQSAERDLRGRYSIRLKRRREAIRSSQAFGHLFKRM